MANLRDNERSERSKFPEIKQKDRVNNYGAWSVKAKFRLRTMKLWDHIEGSSDVPPTIPVYKALRTIHGPDGNGNPVTIHYGGNQAAVDAARVLATPWIEQDTQALDLIMNAVPDDLLYLVKRSSSAKQAWNSLRTSLQPANSTRALSIKQRIVSYNCETGFNVMRWLDDCQRQYDELCNMDPESMLDIEFAKTLIGNMPVDSSWWNFMSGLRQEYSKMAQHPGSIEVINTICDEYWAQHKDDPETYSTVFSAKYHAEGSKKRSLDNSSGNPDGPNNKHQQKAPQMQSEYCDKSKLRCTVKDCESPARHEAHECFAYGGGQQGLYPFWYRGPRDIHLPKSQRETRKTRPRVNRTLAGTTDNSASQGPDITPIQDHNAADSRSAFVPPAPADLDQVNQVSASSRIWMTHIEPGVLDNVVPEVITCTTPIERLEKSDDCYHDSGSNRHVFHTRGFFDEYTEIAPVKIHAFSEGLTIAATGAGSVNLKGSYRGKSAMFTLTNCLHVPAAHANLISQVRLDKFKVSMYFADGKVMLFKDNIPCIDGAVHNEMYRLNLRPVKTKMEEGSLVMMAKTPGDTPDFCIA